MFFCSFPCDDDEDVESEEAHLAYKKRIEEASNTTEKKIVDAFLFLFVVAILAIAIYSYFHPPIVNQIH